MLVVVLGTLGGVMGFGVRLLLLSEPHTWRAHVLLTTDHSDQSKSCEIFEKSKKVKRFVPCMARCDLVFLVRAVDEKRLRKKANNEQQQTGVVALLTQRSFAAQDG